MFSLAKKHYQIGIYGISAVGIILFAIALRFILISQGFPETNSDEGTMGLEAMHIAFRGEHPIFFYGQNYMGVLEAYIAALMFHLFGVSVFSLRLGMLLLFTIFLVCMYFLTSLLYSKKLGLITLLLLSFGSSDMFIQQLRAVGGAEETLLFGSAAFALAVWLALTAQQQRTQESKRLFAYSGWGLCFGLGLWSHVLSLPFTLIAGLLLALFCWQELRRRACWFLIIGAVIGALPVILHTISNPAQNVFATTWRIQQDSNVGVITWLLREKQVVATLLFSLPVATGLSPLGGSSDLPLYTSWNPHMLFYIFVHGSWSVTYIGLLIASLLLSALPLWKLWRVYHSHGTWSIDERRIVIVHCARMALTIAAGFTLLLYMISPLAALKPWSTRYLIGLLIATPAILWPAWQRLHLAKWTVFSWKGKILQAINLSIPLIMAGVLFLSTVLSLNMLPQTLSDTHQQEQLIQSLLRIKATHVYTGYWLGYQMMFQSKEQIICSVPAGLSQPGTNRYIAYRQIVSADPHAVTMYFQGSEDDIRFANSIKHSQKHYRIFLFNGYHVYQPE